MFNWNRYRITYNLHEFYPFKNIGNLVAWLILIALVIAIIFNPPLR